jgi:cell division protein ZapA
MDDKLKIKLSIADRVYPLTVEMSQEEGLRSASKKIDLMIKQFEENYAVRDERIKKINNLLISYLDK